MIEGLEVLPKFSVGVAIMVRTGGARHLPMSACARVLTTVLTMCTGLCIVLAPNRSRAQELRGVVRLPDGVTPAAGVVVVLMHATRTDSIVARGVTTERGRFSLKTPPATPTVLRLLRIGYEPMQGGTFTLARDEIRDASYTLHNNRVNLATIDVKATARCQVQPNGAQLVAQLFQQARTALIASATPLSGTATAKAVNYDRRQNKARKLLRPVERSVTTNATLKPYASIGVDSLDKAGYLVPDGDDYWYYAPDADVLLSDKFLTQHCLQLVIGTDSLAGSIGIGFKPVANRPARVDVQGTLWLDRATSELQFLEYTYTPVQDYLRGEGIGGRVDYAQLPNGGWFVSNWRIRMPILRNLPTMVGRGAPLTGRIVVSALQIVGGTVQEIRLDDQLLYLNTAAAGAGALPGDEVFTTDRVVGSESRLLRTGDLATVRSLCGARMTFGHEGLITGRVFDDTHQPFAGASVTARWKENFSLIGGVMIRWQDYQVSTTTSSEGSYQLCGVAVRRTASVFATRGVDEKLKRPSFVRLSEDSPVAQLDLTLAPPPPKN